MRIPFGWLQDFVKIDMTPEEVCGHLIMLGFSDAEVLANEWDKLEGFVVGRAAEVTGHPSDPHLKVVEVNIGYTSLASVCGAPNVMKGRNYAVALPGAKLGTGRTVDAAEVSGTLSQCILCSGLEAWIDDSADELLEVDADVSPGTALVDALGLDEPVIEVEVTPNRGDCLGLIGIARELSAAFGKELMIPEPPLSENGSRISELVSVEIIDEEACPRYAAIVLEGVKVNRSPAGVRARLRLAGLRPINNVVDVTNLVLFETGHPLHAFDLDRVAQSKILVRRARAGEKLKAIDDNEYDLSSDDLVIADADKPVGLAGVIGGLRSAVASDTTRVLIEGAFFNRTFIWRTAKRLGIDTDASYRFARVVDVGAVLYVLARAASLLQRQIGCKVAKGMIDIYPDPAAPLHIYVNPKRLNRLLGTAIPEQEICDYLERLGFLVSPGRDLEVVVPSRRSDITCEADIAEEVARLYGYDRIDETTERKCRAYGRVCPRDLIFDHAKDVLTGLGLNEVVTDSMIGPAVMDMYGIDAEATVEIRNPVGVENSLLRPTLVPGIVRVLVANEYLGQDTVAVFELGKVYRHDNGELQEAYNLAIGLSGLKEGRQWYSRTRDCDFYDLKGVLESLTGVFGFRIGSGQDDHAILHPGRRASLALLGVREERRSLGYIGEVADGIRDSAGSRRRLYVAEVDFDILADAAGRLKRFTGLPRYPAVKRDLAVVVSGDIAEAGIREAIRNLGGPLVESVELFDVYRGEQIPKGTKSLAYAIVFRSDSGTLMEKDIDDLQKRIEDSLKSEFGGQIRAKNQSSDERG